MSELTKRVEQAIKSYLGNECGMALQRHALTGLAQAAIAAMQADAEPVAWINRYPGLRDAFSKDPLPRGADELGWTEIPLYAHPPVDDRVSTPNSVDDSETGNTSDKPDAIAAAQDVLAGRGNGTYDEALDAIRWLLQSAIAPNTAPAVKSDTSSVSDTGDWRKVWCDVALLSSEHEDVRLNEAVAELHRVIEDHVQTEREAAARAALEAAAKAIRATHIGGEGLAIRAIDPAQFREVR